MTDLTPDTQFDVLTAANRDSLHWTAGTVTWGELLEWMESPADTKACGNYILGTMAETATEHKRRGQPAVPCTGMHRTKLAMRTRSAVTLDVDYPEPGFLADAVTTLDHAFIIHTTFSSSPEHPRYRVIVPLDRPVRPDEYHAAAGALMQALGEKQFDAGSVQAERYMFKPSEQEPGFFRFHAQDGAPASADRLLSDFQTDLSELPAPKPSRNKRDPFALEGTIGAFNRAYADLDRLIEEYKLPYEASGGTDRYQLVGASAAAGMGEVTEGLYFSHHSNDPAYGQTCSAFDLVRLHLYGALDEDAAPGTPVNRLPSSKAMLETASTDVNVVRELVGAAFDDELDESAGAVGAGGGNWRMELKLDPSSGKPRDDIHNWDLIASNDPAFQAVFYNELSMAIEIDADLPWRTRESGTEFRASDRAQLALHIERQYHIRPGRAYLDDLISDRAMPRRRNPVRVYLSGLEWDGVPRVETCIPVEQVTEYTRLVTRKAMVAAVARMMDPGCKWDHMLILHGPEGLGKSHLVDTLSRGYSSNLESIGNKDTLITMQRSWIMTADEGTSLKKSDWDAQKEFITRRDDVFRMPYERESSVHPRHCVIWGTTNDDVFLRKQEGNRRFHILRCARVEYEKLTDEYVDQVWAEAKALYEAGERLWMDEDEEALARDAREEFTEENATAGLVSAYLDTLVPEDWDAMPPESRQLWLLNAEEGIGVRGTVRQDEVCTIQLWVEALGRKRGDSRKIDLMELGTIMKDMPGWEPVQKTRRVAQYGPQKVFRRVPEGMELI